MKRTLMIALCTLILGACSEEKTVQKLVKPVSTMIIGETKTYESRVVSGVVQPSDTTQLSFEVTGKVQEVYFELGEGFEKGQPLAKLDQINYELAVKEREGQLSEAKARLLESRRDFERKSDLVKDGAVSKSQFDISKSQFETAKDQVDIAKARLGMAKEDLDDTTLKAPYKGTVAARMIEPSQRVSPNMAAFTVQGDNGLEVSVLVPESLLSSISIGKVASIEIPAVNMDFNAVIKEIGTAAEDASSFPVTLKINSEDTQKLKPGMSAEVTLEFDRVQEFAEGFKLPVNALLAESENRHFVFKLTKPETISQNNANGQEAIARVVQPSDTTQLSFEVTGKVQEVYFELGEGFEKGQPLAKLDQINYELAVKEREGQLSEAKARLLESRRDFERKSDLVKDGAVSKSQFDISKSQFETAKDQVDIAKARLGMAKEDLDDTTLKAPYKGTVAARMIEPSQRVSPNMAAFTVQGDNGLEVSVLVPESLLSSISIGKVASIEIPAVNMDFNAVIKEIGTAAEDASSFPVTLKINSEDTQKLKPGMSAEVTLEFDRVQEFAEGFKLPVNALLAESENRHFVFKLTKPETISQNNANGQEAIAPEQTQNPDEFILTKAPVEIIQLFDQHAVVGGDLKEGEIIVDAGLPFLSDGLKVTPISKGVNRYNP